jgi:hypothetical protein
MNFTKGECFSNRTRSYLSNIIDSTLTPNWIRSYITEAKRTKDGWKLCNTVGFFRNDLEFQDTFPDLHKHLMFILVDINGEWDDIKGKYKNIYAGREKFQRFTKEFRSKKKAFHWDYPFDDPFKGYLHCFVFDMEQYGMPVKDWSKSIDKFDEGKYSQMFTREELSKLTGVNKTGNIWKTLVGDGDKTVLKKRIEQQFGTVLRDVDVAEHTELDIPYLKRDEILHYDKFNLK